MAFLRKACAVLLVVVIAVVAVAPPVMAGTVAEVALGLAAFAVLMQLARPWVYPDVVERQTTVYIYASPPVATTVSATTAPPGAVVEYSHGRYELRGDGTAVPYSWVWIPNLPAPPPPPPAP